LAADVMAGKKPFLWDRRVQRAIVLALGRRNELARAEIEACIASISTDNVFDLTSLQAYRLSTLARSHGLAFPNRDLAELVLSLGMEYTPAKPPPSAY
jgi:hypothetical protein